MAGLAINRTELTPTPEDSRSTLLKMDLRKQSPQHQSESKWKFSFEIEEMLWAGMQPVAIFGTAKEGQLVPNRQAGRTKVLSMGFQNSPDILCLF
ncbi:hypothetical protein Y1Q_0009984 [Alligator mississippiensis]|uniref:Uncharacterized protein n=1 Tax=Alligator mississippiensis TaxID=8496 RepID=A0A151MLC5_ALLMI|nr:hypothetical protein Y1Q_0009984 [Alligator mississippiensis]